MSVRQIRAALFAGAAVAAGVLIVAAVLAPRVTAAGWLAGLAFWSQILIGSLTLIMIHRLTGGRWGEIIAPAAEPAAATVPLLIILVIPLFVAVPVLYPWPHRPDSIRPDVLSYYLNAPSFIVRSAVALIGWSALAFLLPRTLGRPGQLLAGLGLVFHALAVSSISIDWYLSLEAPFTSSSFGASVAVSALIAALAWAAVLAPAPEGDPAIGDVGGLLLATILGITYIDFMAVLVIWYGDLPREEIWFVERGDAPWVVLAIAAFVLLSLIPILALLLSRVRNARTPLRAVGVCALLGLAVYDAYLIAPPSGAVAMAMALLAIVGIGLALAGLFVGGASSLVSRREAAHAR
jgi:hypothetical protein